MYTCTRAHRLHACACARGQAGERAFASMQSRTAERARACGGAKMHARMHAHVQRVRACIHGFILVQNEKCVKPGTLPFADGHTASNAPDLFRPPKLSGAGPG